jgi:hypothetical protein
MRGYRVAVGRGSFRPWHRVRCRDTRRLLGRQLRAALGTAALQYEAAGLGRHARTKTVSASSL